MMATPGRPKPPRMADGFRQRGEQVTRLEAFIDAAFAFAVTLLVISVDHVPGSLDELLQALRGVPAFAAAFLLIALFWYQHAQWSRRYGLDDTYSTLIGLLLVFLVLVYVYPLKILAGLLFAWITHGWLPWPFEVRSYADIRSVFMIYGVAYATLTFCIAELYAHALRRREALALDRHEAMETAASVVAWRFATGVGLLSAGSAALIIGNPGPWVGSIPGFVYFLMNLTWLVARWGSARMARRLDREQAAS